MRKYDIFLFDADGTFLDYDMAKANALRITFENCGLDYSQDTRMKYREINEQMRGYCDKGGRTKKELQMSRFRRLFSENGINYDEKDATELYYDELGKGSFLLDGALEICKEINSCNKKIYIVTNGIFAVQKARIEGSLIREYISDVFVSEFIGFRKPHISYFDYVFSHIPLVKKDSVLLIGNTIPTDIAGGNNAGIDTCWLNGAGNLNETEIIPTYEIKKLDELERFI